MPASNTSKDVRGKKRKNRGDGKKESAKRRRSFDSDEDDITMNDTNSSSGSSSDSDSDSDTSNKGDELDGSDSDGSDDSDARSEVPASQEEYTEEMLKSKIKETKNAIKDARVRLSAARKERKDVDDHLANLGKVRIKIQKVSPPAASLCTFG